MLSFSAEHESPHSSEDLFDLVADIESYPQFLLACKDAQILEHHPNHLIAHLTLGYGPLRESFISRVFFDRELGVIHAQLEDGPLNHLNCKWSFTQKDDHCHIVCIFELDFYHGRLARIVTPLLDRVAQRLMDNFIRRAEEKLARD